ncbi:MAG: hypothetical protein HQL87_03495 [Magnetococcales bacterium]|nr:hypothetical protein [Magnetococcales bacterium]
MNRQVVRLVLGLSLIVSVVLPVRGEDALNRRKDMDASASSKVVRAEAASMQQGQGQGMNQPLTNPAKCGTNVGTVVVEKGATAPREINTVVKGDVINVCK